LYNTNSGQTKEHNEQGGDNVLIGGFLPYKKKLNIKEKNIYEDTCVRIILLNENIFFCGV
jgi:hypothetical protein